MTVSVGSPITAASYNAIKDVISIILNPSASGYGPDILESTVATTNMIASYAHWNALYRDVNRSIKHQTGSNIPGITAPSPSDTITAAFVNTLATMAGTAVANSGTVHLSQLSGSSSINQIVNVPWSSTVEYISNYTWASNLEACYHFNLGGSLTTTVGYSGIPVTASDLAFKYFTEQANASYSTLTPAYTKSNWLGVPDTVTRTYSTLTTAGVFTATAVYTRSSTGVQVDTTIRPPTSAGTINIYPVSSSTVVYSFDAITANLPGVVANRKILGANTLSTFSFKANARSNPQTLVLSNLGPDPVTVTGITASNNGVFGFVVSDATNLSTELPSIVPIDFPFTIASGSHRNLVTYYSADANHVGTFYNTIVVDSNANKLRLTVNTTQSVSAAEFDFNLVLVDRANPYTYVNWQSEFSLSDSDAALGQAIAQRYYLYNGAIGLVDGVTRYGLYRTPDAEGLKFWVDYTKNSAGGDYTAIASAFYRAVDAAGTEVSRSRTSFKSLDTGFGNGDFYDRTLVDTSPTGGLPKTYTYLILPSNGSVNSSSSNPGYTASLSNQEFNGLGNPEAVAAFSVATQVDPGGSSYIKGPAITFTPGAVNNTGLYSTDMTVTVTATDLDGVIVTKSKTVNLSLNLTNLLQDKNLVQWVSGFETTNAVMGISYDRINGQNHLTVGIGMGADGSPTLANNGYLASYVDVNQLGINGDSKWGTFDQGYGMPVYAATHPAWSQFMKDYAVWPMNPATPSSGSAPQGFEIAYDYKFYAQAGNYKLTFCADDVGSVYIDGIPVLSSTAHIEVLTADLSFATPGHHDVKIKVKNQVAYGANNPGGIAVTIVRVPENLTIWTTRDMVRATAPYLYWAEVYRIPIEPNVVKTYRLNDYVVKNSLQVNNTPSGYFRYGSFFGSPGTADVGSPLTVDSDGKGNLTFNWITSYSAASKDIDNQTLFGITQLPYYYSNNVTRKKNLTAYPGTTTQKLIGMTTTAVRTASATVPGPAYVPIALNKFGNEVDQYDHPNGPYPWTRFLTNTGAANVNSLNIHFILTAANGLPAIRPGSVYTWSFTKFLSATAYGEELVPADKYAYKTVNDYDSETGELIGTHLEQQGDVPLPNPLAPADQSVRDFVVSGNQNKINGYTITVTDGITSASIDLYVGLHW